ncbi:MAG: hypothetical protein R6U52_01570 [Kosmotogaceae bacterium]
MSNIIDSINDSLATEIEYVDTSNTYQIGSDTYDRSDVISNIDTVSHETLQTYVDTINTARVEQSDREWEDSHSISCIIL